MAKRLLSSIWLNIRAILCGILFAAKRHPFATASGLLIFWFVVWGVTNPPPVETPEQVQARQALEMRNAQLRAAAAERSRSLCKLQAVCARYGAARQQCATAGNFENCINVKIGDDDFDEIGSCTNDGSIRYPPDDVPNHLECFLLNIDNTIR